MHYTLGHYSKRINDYLYNNSSITLLGFTVNNFKSPKLRSSLLLWHIRMLKWIHRYIILRYHIHLIQMHRLQIYLEHILWISNPSETRFSLPSYIENLQLFVIQPPLLIIVIRNEYVFTRNHHLLRIRMFSKVFPLLWNISYDLWIFGEIRFIQSHQL